MEELGTSAAEGKVDDLLRQILERTGYARMLQAETIVRPNRVSAI